MNKIKLTLRLVFVFSLDCFSQQYGSDEVRSTAINGGKGLGSVLATVFSWERNKSILRAFIHGISGSR